MAPEAAGRVVSILLHRCLRRGIGGRKIILATKGYRDHYLGPPKTRRGRRTISLSPTMVAVLERNLPGKRPDDLVFTSPQGRAVHQGDFYADRWLPCLDPAAAAGLTKRPRFHDLRHTHVPWLIAAGVPLPAIQQGLGPTMAPMA
jgi:integrase